MFGLGFWKFNNFFFDNEEFVIYLKFFLIYVKEKYCDIKDKRFYWEMIKMEIRDFCSCFFKWCVKVKREREIDLFCKLK